MAKSKESNTNKKVKLTWVKSTIGRPENHKKIIQALGFKKLNSTVEHYSTPTVQGMINKVPHLIKVEEI